MVRRKCVGGSASSFNAPGMRQHQLARMQVQAPRVGHGVQQSRLAAVLAVAQDRAVTAAQWTRSWWVRPVLGHSARKAA